MDAEFPAVENTRDALDPPRMQPYSTFREELGEKGPNDWMVFHRPVELARICRGVSS
jgi:hypothetical protein